jgi:8-oxo-dGTP pyrophosphatase MutT (NUDIX family)
MLRRADKGDQNSGAWVFPGGLVDPGDAHSHDICHGLNDAQASAQLNLPAGGLDHHVAAIRECFEEAGLLLACDRRGHALDAHHPALRALVEHRQQVAQGLVSIKTLCLQHDIRLAVDRLHYVAHWITPPVRPKRFDTRFFLTTVDQDQQAQHDTVETVHHQWIRPLDMLSSEQAGRLMLPQRSVLESLAAFDSLSAIVQWAAQVEVTTRP